MGYGKGAKKKMRASEKRITEQRGAASEREGGEKEVEERGQGRAGEGAGQGAGRGGRETHMIDGGCGSGVPRPRQRWSNCPPPSIFPGLHSTSFPRRGHDPTPPSPLPPSPHPHPPLPVPRPTPGVYNANILKHFGTTHLIYTGLGLGGGCVSKSS